MNSVIGMLKGDLLNLMPGSVTWQMTADEIFWIASQLGAYWVYDYEAAKVGRLGGHAILKSKRHSDAFFVSRILLEPDNIRRIMAHQIVMNLKSIDWRIDVIAGVPDGASKLGEEVAEILKLPHLKMQKTGDGKIVPVDEIPTGKWLLLVEDFCTRGTGFKEAVTNILNEQPVAKIVPMDPVILNRGGLKWFYLSSLGDVKIIAIAEQYVSDWAAEECPLCKSGSFAIKPKETDENWDRLVNSQKA